MTGEGPRWLRAVAGPHGLTLTGWLVLGIPAIAGGGAMLAGGLRQGLVTSLGWGVLGWVALGVAWWVARLTWMSGGSPLRRRLLIVPTYVLGGAARAAVIGLNTPSANVRVTIAVSIVNITFLSIVISVVVDRLRTLDLAAGRLEVIRLGLVEAGGRAAQEAARLRSYARETILAGVRQVLSQGDDAVRVAQGLREVSDLVVRPMSHEIAEAPTGLDGPAFVRPRRDIPSVARATLDARPIRPMVTALLYTAFALPIAYYIHGWPSMVPVLAVTAVCVAFLLGVAAFIPWRRLPTAVGSALLALVLIATGVTSIVVLRFGPAGEGPFAGGAVYAAMFLTLVGGSIAILRGLDYRQAQIEESLVDAARELSEVVRAEMAELRRTRHHLARVLHGVVQPRLVARALLLQRMVGPIDVDALEAEVVGLLSDEVQSDDAVDISRSLGDVAEIWADSVDVTVDVPEAVAAALTRFPSCTRAIGDVACEAVNNAVLRGGARRVKVSLRLMSSRIRLTVVNDVDAVTPASGTPGLGTEIYQELADDWDRLSVEDQVEFWADFSLGWPALPRSEALTRQ